jgi:hypothetical protein
MRSLAAPRANDYVDFMAIALNRIERIKNILATDSMWGEP